MKIYLVRHGQTDANVERRFAGFTDVPLNQVGIEQAERIAKILKDAPIEYIVSSDLVRARKTAEIINQYHGLNINIDRQLREVNFGKFEGLTFEEMRTQKPEFEKQLRSEGHLFQYPEGESLSEAYQRINTTFSRILSLEYNHILIVAHSGTIKSIITKVLSDDLENFWRIDVKNATVSTLVQTDEYLFLERLNGGVTDV